jgi:hypothetical protein
LKENTFYIYQLKVTANLQDYHFTSLEQLRASGRTVRRENYNETYFAPLEPEMTLDDIFERFNDKRPADFTSYSLSVSSVIALNRNGKETAYYVDNIGFSNVPEFLEGNKDYKYYSTQRPISIGTYPKTEYGPNDIVNFDKRQLVEDGRFKAWGYLTYLAALTQKQIKDYELKPADSNP